MTIVARVYIVRHGETHANRMGVVQGQLDTALNEAGIEQAQQTAEALKGVKFRAAYASDLQRAAKTAEMILAKQSASVALTLDEELRERYLGDLQGKQRGGVAMTIPANAETSTAFSSRMLGWWRRVVVHRHVHGTTTSPLCSLGNSTTDVVGATGGGASPCDRWATSINMTETTAATTEHVTIGGDSGTGQRRDMGIEKYDDKAETNTKDTAANVLVVSHGGAIGMMVQCLLGGRKIRCGDGVKVTGKCLNASVTVIEVGWSGKGELVQYSDTRHLDVSGLVRDNADVAG